MIVVIATIEIAPGQRDALLAEFHKIVPLVRDEAGCLEYMPTIDFETPIPAQRPLRPDVMTVVERWESLDALQAHLVAPHMLSYRERAKDLVRNVAIQVLEPA